MPTPRDNENTNETILRNLLEYSKDLIYFKDLNGRFLAINDALAKNYKLTSGNEAVGRSDYDFFSKEQAECFTIDERKILETGKPLLAKEEHIALINGQDVWYSTSQFPLIDDHDKVIGTFGISRDITQSMKYLEALQDRENKLQEYRQRNEFELEQASRIHSALLPKQLSAPAGLKLDFDYRPASSIGGDFFASYQSSDEDSSGLFLCDIMGHGVSAALFTALISSLVATKAKESVDQPSEILKSINQGMLGQMPGSYATGIYSYLHRVGDGSATLTVANAGHLSPLHYKASEQAVTRIARKKAIALGIMHEANYQVDCLKMKPGDKVLFYTDGITEAANSDDDEYGRERLMKLIEALGYLEPPALIEAINDDLQNFTGETQQADDRMLILLSMTSNSSPRD
jgi:sigma-B regulation protein RsbU (phosphoserine phosphatase)